MPVLILVSILTFAGLELVPGDPVVTIVGTAQEGGTANAEDIERIREQFGLTGSLPERYFRYAERVVFHLDFGTSLASQRRVTEVIGQRLPVSLWLNGLALGVSIVLGLTLGCSPACGREPAVTWGSPFSPSSGSRRRTSGSRLG